MWHWNTDSLPLHWSRMASTSIASLWTPRSPPDLPIRSSPAGWSTKLMLCRRPPSRWSYPRKPSSPTSPCRCLPPFLPTHNPALRLHLLWALSPSSRSKKHISSTGFRGRGFSRELPIFRGDLALLPPAFICKCCPDGRQGTAAHLSLPLKSARL